MRLLRTGGKTKYTAGCLPGVGPNCIVVCSKRLDNYYAAVDKGNYRDSTCQGKTGARGGRWREVKKRRVCGVTGYLFVLEEIQLTGGVRTGDGAAAVLKQH